MKFSYPIVTFVLTSCLSWNWASAQEAGWGQLSGQIIVKGTVPEPPDEKVDKDEAACVVDGKMPKDDNLVVSTEGGLSDVFVMIYLDRGDAAPKIHPSYDEKKNQTIELDNQKCRFVPHAVFVRTGQKLLLKNSDDVGHNCHIQTFGNEENVNLPANGSAEVTLKKSEKVPGPVVCDIHKWMDAVILVRDEPYVAITDADGKFKIENIPAGKWKFQFWHKQKGYLREIEIGGSKTGKRGEVELAIPDQATLDLGAISIDAGEFKK